MSKFEMTSGNGYGYGFNYTTQDSDNDRYPELLQAVKERFEQVASSGRKLFTTNAKVLYEAYLDGFPVMARPHYRCHCCSDFITRFGGLVYMTEAGKIKSALWDANAVPSFFRKSVQTMQSMVENAHITGVFKADETVLGNPRTGTWDHFSVNVPRAYVNQSRIQTAYQWMAEKKEEYNTLNNAITKFTFSTVEHGLHVVQSGNLPRVEKIAGMAKWFYDLRVQLKNQTNGFRTRSNIIWKAVAEAPTGFCHIPSSNYGAFLEDIQAGLPFQVIKDKHKDRVNPLVYQRPQSAPKAGNITRAEKIVAALKSEGALSRSFARLDQIKALWKPTARVQKSRQGVFDHLYGKEDKHSDRPLPVSTMTWEKFARTVVPHAEEIEYLVKGGNHSFSAILTATSSFAPPILQWDNEEQRNPFSWYVYGKGSTAYDWSLPTGYVKVNAITLQPSMWYGEYPHQGKAVHFILDGAKDRRYRGAGNAIFPETLKSEYREIRSTIEAYSRGEIIQGGHYGALANGIRLQDGHNWDAQFKVKLPTGTAVYKLDRWD